MSRFIFSVNDKKKIDGYYFLKYLLIIFFASEAITNVLYYSGLGFYNASALIKAIFLIFVFVLYINGYIRKQRDLVFFLLLLFIAFLVGQFFFGGVKNFKQSIYDNSVFFFRYILIFVIFIFVEGLYNRKFHPTLFITYEHIIIINTSFLIIGAVFEIELFSTYEGTRFGYNGFFLVPSIATYFYSLALTYYASKITRENNGYLIFVLLAFTTMLVGTKALFLFLVLTLINLFFHFKLYNSIRTYIILFISVTGIIFFRDYIFKFLTSTYSIIFDVYKEYGWTTMVTSFRDIKLKNEFPDIINNKMSLVNYLIGGTDFSSYRVEFEIIDVFLFFGILGGGMYLYFYFKKIIRFRHFDNFSRLQIIFLLITALLSGTFFNNGAVGMYLIVVLNKLMIKKDEIQN